MTFNGRIYYVLYLLILRFYFVGPLLLFELNNDRVKRQLEKEGRIKCRVAPETIRRMTGSVSDQKVCSIIS